MSFFDEIKKDLHLGGEENPPVSVPPSAPVPAQSGRSAAAPQTPPPASQGRVLLIHGYSANWKALLPWRDALANAGFASDMIDVGVGNKDLLESKGEGGEAAMDAGDLVSGIDDDGFAGFLVGQNCAVALQRADREGLKDHGFIVGRR